MSDTLAFGLRFSLIGMSIVFAVLLLIACVVTVMQRLDRKHAKPGAPSRDQNIDDLTLVLIAAAAAAMLAGRARIRSIKRVRQQNTVRSPWSLQGRATLLGSHQIRMKGR